MEFLDEEARPRLLFQSRAQTTATPEEHHTVDFRKPWFIVSISLSILLFVVSIFSIPFEPFKSITLWIAFSLLLGPFCPSSLTGGDIRVGVGKVLEPPHQSDDSDLDDQKKQKTNRRSKVRKSEEPEFAHVPAVSDRKSSRSEAKASDDGVKLVEEEWNEGDFELLKKLLAKNPVGKPKRWEVIAEGFQGRHGVDSVIKMAKSIGERKLSDSDSFSRFLKDRKATDKRVESGIEAPPENDESRAEKGGLAWSSAEDIALLNALKAFPKEVPMRWEKIAAAVPGKTKAACMKRVTELKKGFRSSKASADN